MKRTDLDFPSKNKKLKKVWSDVSIWSQMQGKRYLYAKIYGGKMILRFDDTNPVTEKIEFEENIMHDYVDDSLKVFL